MENFLHDQNSDLFSQFESIVVGTQGFAHGDMVSQKSTEYSLIFQQALVFHSQNRFSEVELLYRQIHEVSPHHAETLHRLGELAFSQNRYPDALQFIEDSLKYQNDNSVYCNNYGVVLQKLNRAEDARKAFEKAILLQPNYSDALANLASLFLSLHHHDEDVERLFTEALKNDPKHLNARFRFAEFLFREKRYDESLKQLKTLLEITPNDAAILMRTAENYASLRRFFKAAEYIKQAVLADPGNSSLLERLASYQGELGEIDDAKNTFHKIAELNPNHHIWKWKHLAFCPVFFENEIQIDDYWIKLNRELDEAISEQKRYDWKTLPYVGFTSSFNLSHINKPCRYVKEKYAKLFAPSFPVERPEYRPEKKIRVGFLVTPGHEGGFLRLTSGIIESLDPEKFEVVLLFNETTKEHFEKFKRADLEKVPFSWNFEEAVQTIRSARCDLLYYWKVGADTWNFFLPMCRLAPIQFTSWGTHATSGVEQIDYYLSWDKVEVPHAQEHYTEKLFLLRTSPLYEPLLQDLPSASRKELKLPENGAIYFCPHRAPKYHPMFDGYLKGILEQDRTGHIVLVLGKDWEEGKQFIDRMRKTIGEELFTRMIVLPHLNLRQYFRFLSVSSVALNSPVFTGGITTIDGFIYGVPCITQTGEYMYQRHSSAYCEEFGVPETVALNREEYVEKAVKIGKNDAFRKITSSRILDHREMFYDNKETVHEWERFILEVTSR